MQQNLTTAVLSRAKVVEQVLVDNLTEKAAYKLEYEKLRAYVFAGKRDQLWNVIPASIQTPEEQQAIIERLKRNLNSRDRWIRYFSARWTGQGHDRHRTPDYHVRPEADSVLDAASATTSRVDAEELGGVMTEKLAELFAESATEEHALRPVRRRRLDS